MRVRRVRCLVLLFFLIAVVSGPIYFVVHLWSNYNEFVGSFEFSSVPFWNDSRLSPSSIRRDEKRSELNSSRLVIAACCRNVFSHLRGFQRNVEMISSLFADYRLILGESRSSDSTRRFLLDWKKNDSSHLRLFFLDDAGERKRTTRIARCRNTLLSSIYTEFSSFDYYLVVDVDVGSSSSFTLDDFLSNFYYSSPSWLALTATQRGEYYDIWPLRIEKILPFDCWKKIKDLTSFIFGRSELIRRLIRVHQERPVPRDLPLIPVQSAFGGAAIYRLPPLVQREKKCFYRGENEDDGAEQCEHVAFHRCLSDNRSSPSIFINPQFQIC